MTTPWNPPAAPFATNARNWVYLGLAMVLLAVGAQYVVKSGEDRSAFNRWRRQVQDLVRGEDVYLKYTYPNAPMMGLILYPLSLLPKVAIGSATFDLGALAWFTIKIGMTLLAFRWTVQLIEGTGAPFPGWAQVLMLVLSARPIVGDLTHGNVNLLILFLVVAMLREFQHGRQVRAGVVLALAITCKVTPALFIPYFIWKRAWRVVAGCLLGLPLFFLVIPGSLLGYDHTVAITRNWVDKMILPYTLRGEVTTEHHNQSLPGLLYRLTTANPSFLDEDDQPVAYHNLVAWSPDTVRWLVKACGIGFLVFMVWSCRTPVPPRSGWRFAGECAIIVLGMLLLSERTWKHHCVTMLLPFGVLCYVLGTQPLTTKARLAYFGTLLLATLVMASSSTSLWEAVGGAKMGAKLAQVYGAYVAAEFMLLAAVAVTLRTTPSTAEGPIAEAAHRSNPHRIHIVPMLQKPAAPTPTRGQ